MKKFVLIAISFLIIFPLNAQDSSILKNGVSYSVGMNAWVGSENDDDKGTPVEGLVTDISFHFQFTYKYPTKKSIFTAPFIKGVQQYYSFRALQFRSHAADDDYEWVESTQAYGFVYGRRYFFQDNYVGLNIGWYLGLALAINDGYEWEPGVLDIDTTEPFNEKVILPLNALEISYHLAYKVIFIEPTFSLYIDSKDFAFDYFPSVIVGLQLK